MIISFDLNQETLTTKDWLLLKLFLPTSKIAKQTGNEMRIDAKIINEKGLEKNAKSLVKKGIILPKQAGRPLIESVSFGQSPKRYPITHYKIPNKVLVHIKNKIPKETTNI